VTADITVMVSATGRVAIRWDANGPWHVATNRTGGPVLVSDYTTDELGDGWTVRTTQVEPAESRVTPVLVIELLAATRGAVEVGNNELAGAYLDHIVTALDSQPQIRVYYDEAAHALKVNVDPDATHDDALAFPDADSSATLTYTEMLKKLTSGADLPGDFYTEHPQTGEPTRARAGWPVTQRGLVTDAADAPPPNFYGK
jgi:hypothetical protein